MKIRSLLIDDCLCAAQLHAQSFSAHWSAASLEKSLTAAGAFGFAAWGQVTRPAPDNMLGFILAQSVGDEAEILTLAVASANRRQGIGAALLQASLRYAQEHAITAFFLEVDETNNAARTLYDQAGFSIIGERPHYYGDRSAIMMRWVGAR